MIIGMTTEQQRAKKKLKLVELAIGKWKFAIFPARLTDGRMLWLQKYYEVSDEFIALNENNEYRIEHYYGTDKYAYKNLSDVKWIMYELQNTKYLEYKRIQGGAEIFGKLIYIKEELLAIINN